MKWKITNKKNNKVLEFSCGKLITIGSMRDCDIILDMRSDSIAYQIILERGFLFCSSHEHDFVCFQKLELFFNEDMFLFECDFLIELFMENKPSYDKLNFIYANPGFYAALESTRDLILQEKQISNFPLSISEFEVLKITCSITSSWLLISHGDVFKEHIRMDILLYIWTIYNEICGYGILSLALLDSEVCEIMVNGPNKIYFEKSGCLELSALSFKDTHSLQTLIERICTNVGRRIDNSMPYCDARLSDGSRVHAIIPPLALNGPCLTIRKFPKIMITSEFLIQNNSVTSEVMAFFKKIILDKKNILISGGTGSGKTTLLNCLSSFIPYNERIITIEDAAELQLQQDHIVRLESRSINAENKGLVSLRELVRNALRMRPNRIIVGECRGGEALDMLQAMNTGHDGSMTTVHANNPLDALRRIETLVLFSEFEIPARAIREQIASALDFVIQQTRFTSGKRCVTAVYKINGLCEKTLQFQTEIIYENVIL